MKNPFDRFSEEAKIALQFAEDFAEQNGAEFIGSEHLLLGISTIPKTISFEILNSLGVDFEIIKNLILKFNFGKRSSVNGKITVYLTKIIEDSVKFASKNNHTLITVDHLLYCICSNLKSAGYIALNELEIDSDSVKEDILEGFKMTKETSNDVELVDGNKMKKGNSKKNPFENLFTAFQGIMDGSGAKGGSMVISALPSGEKGGKNEKYGEEGGKGELKSKTPTLDFFTTDYTKLAREGKIDPIIGREEEIQRTINILNRKTKNSPVLIGEAGVGKTAIAEGLAVRINNGNVPFSILNKRVLNLDLSNLIAGTSFRGEFEERLQSVIAESSLGENNVILFIDEIHTLVGLGGSGDGTMDASNILKPAMARGKIQIIGATTIDEYKKRIEKDKALDRRFQKVAVNEPTDKETLDILKGIKSSFENYHNVKITKEAINSAISLSKRYIPEKFLPDKAIDLLDESCAKMGNALDKELILKKKKFDKELSKIEKEKKELVNSQDFEKSLVLKNREEAILSKIDEMILNHKIPKNKIPVIGKQNVLDAISLVTGIHSIKNSNDDNKKLLKLSTKLGKNIIGQDNILEKISKTILRNRAGVSSPNRPVGSFLLLGPTGVGKTETVKILAKELFDSKNALIKIDMSEFGEKHNVSRLTGASAGYIGHEEGGQLTEAVRKKPYSIVLFDEIEKAHPESYNILLQILEDGILTDGRGKEINFKNTIVVMTSNLGAETLTQEATQIGFETDEKDELKEAKENFEEKKEEVLEEIKDYFLPELLNRIDKILVYNPLDKNAIKKIVKLQLDDLEKRISEQDLSLDFSKNIIDTLANLSYDADSGARKVRRVIQEKIEEELSEKIINGDIKQGDVVKIIKKRGSKGDEKKGNTEFEIVKKK